MAATQQPQMYNPQYFHVTILAIFHSVPVAAERPRGGARECVRRLPTPIRVVVTSYVGHYSDYAASARSGNESIMKWRVSGDGPLYAGPKRDAPSVSLHPFAVNPCVWPLGSVWAGRDGAATRIIDVTRWVLAAHPRSAELARLWARLVESANRLYQVPRCEWSAVHRRGPRDWAPIPAPWSISASHGYKTAVNTSADFGHEQTKSNLSTPMSWGPRKC